MYTLTIFLLTLFCLYIGGWALIRWDASWLRNLDAVPSKLLFVLLFAFFLGAALVLLHRLTGKLSEKNLKRTAFFCMLILVAGQLVLLFSLRPMLRYDPLKTFDMAVEMLETQRISGTYETGYFSRYTNNYPITILTYWFLRLLKSCGLKEASFLPACQLVNIACISGSIWLSYQILLEKKNRREAVFFLLICVLCPLSYVWAGFFYTTTCSLPCLTGILFLSIRLPKTKKPLSRLLLGALLGGILVLGYKLRATAMIAGIAVALTAILRLTENLRRQRGNGRGPKDFFLSLFRKYAGFGAAFFLTALLFLGLFRGATEKYVPFDYENTGFPMIHWVMMGSRWDGAFDQMDELYTGSFATKEEKIQADKKVLAERIQEAGPLGLTTLFGRKLLNTWVDGTDGYLAENSYCSYSRLYQYLMGSQSGFVTLYSQAFRALQMIALGLFSLVCLVRLWKKKEKPTLFLIQLTFLGGMAFHLIWETNPLYSISFTFFGLMLLAEAVACLDSARSLTPLRKRSPILSLAAFFLLLAMLILSKKELVKTPIERENYCVNQYQYAGGYDGPVKAYEQVYTQTFTTDRPFNRIAVRAVNPVGPYNQSAFLVKLTDEKGQVLYDNDRFLSGMVVANTPYIFELPSLIVPEGLSTYTLEIAPGYIQGENSLEFLSYTTGNCDLYRGGSLSIGGEEIKNGDLAFSVFEYQVTTYFSLKLYLFICAFLLLLAGGLTAAMWKYSRL